MEVNCIYYIHRTPPIRSLLPLSLPGRFIGSHLAFTLLLLIGMSNTKRALGYRTVD